MKGIISQTSKAFRTGQRYVINEGGTRSSKTFSVLTVLINIANSRPFLVCSVVSETFPHLRKGAIRDFQSIMQRAWLWSEVNWSKSESTYTFASGSIIEFFSVDAPGKVHGPARDILFINEAQNIDYEIARHLFVRTTGTIFIDFNPTHEFWAHTELKPDAGTTWIHSTYKDNPYLTAEQVKEIERNRHNLHWWTVYGEGKIGRLEGLVFPSFALCDQMPDGGVQCYGLDFGYTNDPTALVEVKLIGENLYIRQHVYRTGLLNRDIAAMMEAAGVVKHYDEVFADSAEPKTIEELRQSGYNIRPADKGKDSILTGIQFINQHRLHVTKDSTDLIKELRNYTYITDSTGAATNKPIDAFNHAIDALRYAVFTKFRPREKTTAYIPPPQRTYKL